MLRSRCCPAPAADGDCPHCCPAGTLPRTWVCMVLASSSSQTSLMPHTWPCRWSCLCRTHSNASAHCLRYVGWQHQHLAHSAAAFPALAAAAAACICAFCVQQQHPAQGTQQQQPAHHALASPTSWAILDMSTSRGNSNTPTHPCPNLYGSWRTANSIHSTWKLGRILVR
jgi:hypothetical protein